MELPTRLKITGFAYAFDGGTTILDITDESGGRHSLMVIQHASVQPGDLFLPGRLYFNGNLVDLRSEQEVRILDLLEAAEIEIAPSHAWADDIESAANAAIFGEGVREVLRGTGESFCRRYISEFIHFARSEDYLRFARGVEKAADPQRYTAWPEFTPATRSRVIVRLGSLLSLGVPGARQLLDSGAPLARNLSSVEAGALADRYPKEGIRVRFEPEFRWPIG